MSEALKTEPPEPLLETLTPKEYLITNGIPEDDHCKELSFFTDLDVESTQKCYSNMCLIIKDFETQLDWHLQQYMIMRKVLNEGTSRQERISIAKLSYIISNYPEGNRNFLRKKTNSRKRNVVSESESESETDEQIKEEIIEEEHELVSPKAEDVSDDEVEERGKKRRKRGRPTKKRKTGSAQIDTEPNLPDLEEVKQEIVDVVQLLKNKAVLNLENMEIDTKKPTIVLNQENYKYFNYKNCKSNNVFINFDEVDSLPEFIYDETVSKRIINNSIFLVKSDVFMDYCKGAT